MFPFATPASSSDQNDPGTSFATRDGSHGRPAGACRLPIALSRVHLRQRYHQTMMRKMLVSDGLLGALNVTGLKSFPATGSPCVWGLAQQS